VTSEGRDGLTQVRAPSPGTAFLRTLERPHGAAWRLLVVLLASVVGLVVFPTLVLVAAVGLSRLLGESAYRLDISDGVSAADMLVINLGLAALIAWAALIVRVLYGVRPRWLSSTRPGLRWGWLGACVLMAIAVWSLLLVLGTGGAIYARQSPLDAGVLAFVVVVLLTTPLQAAGEEYLFRGLLLQALGALRWPLVVCCVVNGVLFAAAHLQFDPPLFADRALLGGVLAFLAARTGGLEAGIAIHSIYNVSTLLPAGILDRVDKTLDPRGVTWVPLIIHAVLLAIIVPWVLAAAGRRTSLSTR
jgi:membrane protease YdiL (CAAX protease family)